MSQELPCPRCGVPAENLKALSAGMKLALQAVVEEGDSLPPEVCGDCFNELSGQVSHGAKLRAEIVQKEKNKQMMWKSRVKLVKQARLLMSQRAFPEAAVAYEKYLRVLEIAHDVEKGELTPDIFSRSKHSKEMTVVTSTYWDLFRIYDRSAAYQDKMKKTGDKLAQFMKYSSITPDILRKAESFRKTAKHPVIVKEFIKKAGGKRGGCFIATAVFENSPQKWQVVALRQFRDSFLRKTKAGRRIIFLYYRLSPPLARCIDRHPLLGKILAIPLSVAAWTINLFALGRFQLEKTIHRF